MATWKQLELAVLQQFFGEKATDVLLNILQERLPGRSRAAIKKKFLEIRTGRPAVILSGAATPSEESTTRQVETANQATEARPTRFVVWNNEELVRLEDEYRSVVHLRTKKARIEAIIASFPGRTLKAIETKLREKYPRLYNTQPGQQPPEPHKSPSAASESARATTLAVQGVFPPSHPVLATPPSRLTQQFDRSQPTVTFATTLAHPPVETLPTRTTSNHVFTLQDQEPFTRTPMESSDLRREFRKAFTLSYSRCRPKKLIKFCPTTYHHKLIEDIDAVLKSELESICLSVLSAARRHKVSKHAILAAGYLLRSKVVGSMGKVHRKPCFANTEKKITKLKRHIDAARELQHHGQAPLTLRLQQEATTIRRLRMTPAQYICTTQDRVELLETRLREERARHKQLSTRYLFQEQPSLRVIRVPGEPQSKDLDWAKARDFFGGLYSPAAEQQSPTWYESWLNDIRGGTANTTDTLQMPDLNRLLEEALRYTAPWKAPGADEVPAALYKMLPSAKAYLFQHATRTLQGEYKMTRDDVQARTVLLFKSGDPKEPQNYRPIALLNTDYKIITKVVNAVIRESVKNIIPKEQMSRPGAWGTLHGLLLDKAATQLARLNRREHHTAWFDFRKAFDSVDHVRIRDLVAALKIPEQMKSFVCNVMGKWNLSLGPPGQTPIRIPIRRGVYQGDSLSPLLFVLTTASIIKRIKDDPIINRLARGKHEIVAYMDDIKCHAPSKAAIQAIVTTLQESSQALGLVLNLGKCGYYCSRLGDEDGIEDLIPVVRTGYKYLGLVQTERDTIENLAILDDKVLSRTAEIMESGLTTAQKRYAFNSSVIPAAVYIMGNIRPDASVKGTLKRCRELDIKVRRVMTDQNIKGRTNSNQRAYLPHTLGGLGFRSIEVETEIQYARRFAYLTKNPDLYTTLERYKKLDLAGWRTPLSDFKFVSDKYDLVIPVASNYQTLASILVKQIKTADLEERKRDWSKAMYYPSLVLAVENNIFFPAANYFRMDSSKLSLVNTAAEEQLYALRAHPGRPSGPRGCRKGCQHVETSYHVVTACSGHNYFSRHDQVVYWLLRTLLNTFRAPEEVKRRLQFGQASLNADIQVPDGIVKIRAGQSILTGVPLHHNKPDVMVQILTRETRTILFEISVPHLQNYKMQEEIKRVKYSRNSVAHITNENYKTINRDLNLVDQLSHLHRTRVELGLFIIGCYGEIVVTDEHRQFRQLLRSLGTTDHATDVLLTKAAYSVVTETSKLLMRHLHGQQDTAASSTYDV